MEHDEGGDGTGKRHVQAAPAREYVGFRGDDRGRVDQQYVVELETLREG